MSFGNSSGWKRCSGILPLRNGIMARSAAKATSCCKRYVESALAGRIPHFACACGNQCCRRRAGCPPSSGGLRFFTLCSAFRESGRKVSLRTCFVEEVPRIYLRNPASIICVPLQGGEMRAPPSITHPELKWKCMLVTELVSTLLKMSPKSD